MQKIERFWNIVYYNIYRFDSKCRKLFNYLNPLCLINNIPVVKRYHSKNGVEDMNKLVNRMLNNPRTGISSIWSGSFMGGLLVAIGYSFFNIFQKILGFSLIESVWENSFHFIIYLIILVVPSAVINRYLLFQKDKCLNYFKEFEAMSDKKKSIYGWMSLFVVILIFTFFILSFHIL
jgi:hypothetical protein